MSIPEFLISSAITAIGIMTWANLLDVGRLVGKLL